MRIFSAKQSLRLAFVLSFVLMQSSMVALSDDAVLSDMETKKDAVEQNLTPTLSAQDAKAAFNQALADYRAGNVERAIPALELSARRGAFLAKFLLAYMYEKGRGVPVDHVKAFDFHNQIINQYSQEDAYFSRKAVYAAKSFVAIGNYMRTGIEDIALKPNLAKARQYYEKAAFIGEREGQYRLGRLLLDSPSEGSNRQMGLRWMTHAAKKNYAAAQTFLAEAYWRGQLVKKQPALALAWLDFAQRNAIGAVSDWVTGLQGEMSADLSPDILIKSQKLVDRLRDQYKLIWREKPVLDNEDEKFFDGIIIASPPNGFELQDVPEHVSQNENLDLNTKGVGPAQMLLGGVENQKFGFPTPSIATSKKKVPAQK